MVRIVKDSGGMFYIGEYSIEGSCHRLGNPCALQLTNGSNNIPVVQVVKMFGNPKIAYFHGGIVSWDIQDKTLLSVYRDRVSGLVVTPD